MDIDQMIDTMETMRINHLIGIDHSIYLIKAWLLEQVEVLFQDNLVRLIKHNNLIILLLVVFQLNKWKENENSEILISKIYFVVGQGVLHGLMNVDIDKHTFCFACIQKITFYIQIIKNAFEQYDDTML